MKKLLSVLVAALLIVGMLPLVIGETVTVGSGMTVTMETEDFVPQIWMDPDSRVVYTNPQDDSEVNVDREHNYAFTGEQIFWEVVVFDKNGYEKIDDVYVTVGPSRGPESEYIEVNCNEISRTTTPFEGASATVDEEPLDYWDWDTMRWYRCELTVEPGMHGEYFVKAEVVDIDGLENSVDEEEFWFLNPAIELTVDGDIDFGTVRPGTLAYSEAIVITNDAEAGSGVMLDMAISGYDFYDPENSGAKCPTSNVLLLNDNDNSEGPDTYCSTDLTLASTSGDNFCYYASHGAYTTATNPGSDAEGYDSIPYERNADPDDRKSLIDGTGNVLSPGDDITLVFRLRLPLPCNGDFSMGGGANGQGIFLWAEAV